MTTIAFDGTTLCADRRLSGNFIMTGAAKIARTSDGRLIGCSGASAECRLMMAWLSKARRDVDVQPDFQDDEDTAVEAIEVMTDGAVRYYWQGGFCLVENGYFAIGSGAKFAMAAVYCGKTAQEAVEVAAHFDNYTGGSIDCLTLLSR